MKILVEIEERMEIDIKEERGESQSINKNNINEVNNTIHLILTFHFFNLIIRNLYFLTCVKNCVPQTYLHTYIQYL